jgi:PAS domain S-box-containing protein
MRLLTKILLVFVGLILLLSVIRTYSAVRLIEKTALEGIRNRLSSDANLLTLSIERELFHMEQHLTAAARATGYHGVSSLSPRHSLQSLVGEALEGNDMSGAIVTDGQGRIIAEEQTGKNRYTLAPVPAGDRTASGFSTVHSDQGEQVALVVSIPIVYGDASSGRLTGFTPLGVANPLVARTQEILLRDVDQPVYISIFFRDRRLLSTLVRQNHLTATPLSPDVAKNLYEDGVEYFGVNTVQGKPFVVMYKPARDLTGASAWAYGIAVSEKVLTAPRRRTLYAFVAISAFATAAAIALAFLLAGGINPSLRKIVERCARIEAGDFADRIDTSDLKVAEFRSIGSALNKLAGSIAEREAAVAGSLEALAKANADLEETSKKVRLERRKYLVMLETMEDGLATVDGKGIVTYFNRAAESITGLNRRVVIGRHHSRFLPATTLLSFDRAGSEEVLVDAPQEGQHLKLHAYPYSSEAGEKGSILLFRDISTEKKMEEFKADFISAIAHDIKALLVPSRGFLKRILDERYGPVASGLREKLLTISDSTARIYDLVENYLSASRIESGRMEMRLAPCDALEIAGEVAQLYGPRVRVRPNEGLPVVLADRTYVERVFINLITNALKFSPEDKDVTVDAAREGDAVRVSVTDQGIGIPPDEIPYIFERYRRGSATLKAAGSGLGLFIAQAIVKAHGGRIWVESTANRGSAFSFTLPVFTGEP